MLARRHRRAEAHVPDRDPSHDGSAGRGLVSAALEFAGIEPTVGNLCIRPSKEDGNLDTGTC